MFKGMKKNLIAAGISLGAMILSMLGTSLVQTNGWSVQETSYTLTLKELGEKMAKNTEGNGRVVTPLFSTSDETAQYSFTTYIPRTATKENPAPVVIGCHGYNNSKEQQLPNITELTKRGFVVVVPDLGGHGRSDVAINDLTQGTEGVVAAVQYAMTMDCVDPNRIGMTGHSAGNLDASNTINLINKANPADAYAGNYTPNYTVSAFFCPAGTISALFASMAPNLNYFGVAAGKYDELDTYYFDTKNFLEKPLAAMMVRNYYPGFPANTPVKEGQWYGATGELEAPTGGNKIAADRAAIVYNPAMTHVGGVWCPQMAEATVDFFYAAYGTPHGNTYLAGRHQTWLIGTCFQIIGLIGFLSAALTFGGLLLKTKAFSSLAASENGVAMERGTALEIEAKPMSKEEKKAAKKKERENLPSILDWKEFVPIIVTFVPLILFPFFMYFKCYAAGNQALNPETYTLPNVNGLAWFNLICGIFSFLMIGVNYIAKRLCHLKDGVKVPNPFSVCKVNGGLPAFAKTVLYSLVVLVLVMLPQALAYFAFKVNFSISVFTVGFPRLNWIPMILFTYLPLWLAFLVPNVMLNNGFRYKEIPEWGCLAFIIFANLFPIVLSLIINYTTLVSTGQCAYTFGDPTIMEWNLLIPMVVAAVGGRYYYKKTKNIWAAALIIGLVLTVMACTITRHTVDFTFNR